MKDKVIEKMREWAGDEAGQFSIPNLVLYIAYLYLVVKTWPQIYNITDEAAQTSINNGDPLTANIIRLIPLSIGAVTIGIPFHWAKPYILGRRSRGL